MTNAEAKETIKTAIAEVEWNYPMDYTIAFETAIEALEKQIPKKPIYTNEGTVTRCPICKAIHIRCMSSVEVDYCERCGQAIDWSEED